LNDLLKFRSSIRRGEILRFAAACDDDEGKTSFLDANTVNGGDGGRHGEELCRVIARGRERLIGDLRLEKKGKERGFSLCKRQNQER
jgi:hypothetical protein